MNLQEFFDYKNQLMGDLITTKEIVELMGDNVTLVGYKKENSSRSKKTSISIYQKGNKGVYM